MKNSICRQIKSAFLFCLILSLNFLILSCKTNTSYATQLNIANNSKSDDLHIDPELKKNRELWAKSSICSYDIIIEGSGSFPVGITEPIDIEVKSGFVSNIDWSSKNKNNKTTQDQIEIIQNQYQNFLSVEKLFDFIELEYKDIGGKEHPRGRLVVSYNSQFGYPEKINYVFFGADGSMSFNIKKFEVLNSQNPCS